MGKDFQHNNNMKNKRQKSRNIEWPNYSPLFWNVWCTNSGDESFTSSRELSDKEQTRVRVSCKGIQDGNHIRCNKSINI